MTLSQLDLTEVKLSIFKGRGPIHEKGQAKNVLVEFIVLEHRFIGLIKGKILFDAY